MHVLYYSPGACSLASHVALEELGVPYRLEEISTRRGEHLGADYARINPLQRVPTLQLPSGELLTESLAILDYLAGLAPSRRLLPEAGLARTRALEWMSLLTSAVHPPFAVFFNPTRLTDNEELWPRLKPDALATFWKMLSFVDQRLEHDHCLGADYSLCDAYAAVFYLWGVRVELPVSQLRRYSALSDRVLARPAVRAALEQEGLSDLLRDE